MNLKSLPRLQLCYHDVIEFALLSNDYNPYHLNRSLFNKFFTGCAPHGILLLLKTFETFRYIPRSFIVNWHQPVLLESPVYLYREDNRISAIDSFGVLFFDILLTEGLALPHFLRNEKQADFQKFFLDTPLVHSIEDLQSKIGSSLSLPSKPKNFSKCCSRLFPFLAGSSDIDFIYDLMCCSYIIGMIWPGANSLFTCLAICNRPAPSDITEGITYQLTGFSRTASLLTIVGSTPTSISQLKASLTSNQKVLQQNARMTLLEQDHKKLYKGHRALVIGASNGLGASAAFILASFGFDLILTYNRDEPAAEQIKQDISLAFPRINVQILQFSVGDEVPYIFNSVFDVVAIFATPPIRPSPYVSSCSASLLRLYLRYYVRAFAELFKRLHSIKRKQLFFCPSSAFLDSPSGKYREYIRAKELMEGLAGALRLKYGDNVIISTPRLPMVRTRQTKSAFQNRLLCPTDVLIPILTGELEKLVKP
jgi:hypothetical protein